MHSKLIRVARTKRKRRPAKRVPSFHYKVGKQLEGSGERRRTDGVETDERVIPGKKLPTNYVNAARCGRTADDCRPNLCPLRRGNRAATAVLSAELRPHGGFVGTAMMAMRSLSYAAGVSIRRDRRCRRSECPGEEQYQQQAGSQAIHGLLAGPTKTRQDTI
jgi:hypothetical protein